MFSSLWLSKYKSTHISMVPFSVRMYSSFFSVLPVFSSIISLWLLLSYSNSYFKQDSMGDKVSCCNLSLQVLFPTCGWHSKASMSIPDPSSSTDITMGSLLDANSCLDSIDLIWTTPSITSWCGVMDLSLMSPEQEIFDMGSWLSSIVRNKFSPGKNVFGHFINTQILGKVCKCHRVKIQDHALIRLW